MQDDYGNALGQAKTINERLQMLGDSITEVRESLSSGDVRMTRIEDNAEAMRAELAANTKATKAIAENTSELVEFFAAMKGAFKVLNWLGKIAKPVAAIVGLCTALFAAYAAWRAAR